MSEMLQEIKSKRAEDPSPRLDVSSEVNKYIKPGSAWSDVLKKLSEDKFNCRHRSASMTQTNSGTVDCFLDMSEWYQFTSKDKLQLHVLIRDGVVAGVAGYLTHTGF